MCKLGTTRKMLGHNSEIMVFWRFWTTAWITYRVVAYRVNLDIG